MTQRTIDRYGPFGSNGATGGLIVSPGLLDKVLSNYFKNKKAFPEISKRIIEAVVLCNLEMQANPLRKKTEEQRSDRRELIACIMELGNRIDPFYIPLPLLNTARTAYRPYNDGKATLGEEIRDLRLRLNHIKRLFESIEIPAPKETNPGAPERKRFEAKIADIFDAFINDASIKKDASEGARKDVRHHFVRSVSIAFNDFRNAPKIKKIKTSL